MTQSNRNTFGAAAPAGFLSEAFSSKHGPAGASPRRHLHRMWAVAAVIGLCAFAGRAPAEPRTFASPDEAVSALRQATMASDNHAIRDLFGPDFDKLGTGDKAQDAKNEKHFAEAVAQSCRPIPSGDGMVEIEVGTNEWPMPIPLVRQNGRWHFDTAAGREEIISRHIGKDEIHAIGLCRAYLKAQQQYATLNAGLDGSYALKFMSADGSRDGLYWKSGPGDPMSPFSQVVAEAESKGYIDTTGSGPKPYHGYFFRILTAQGADAPGGAKNYVSEGLLAQGFALVAFPEKWDRSGIMTFIVNQDGIVYEKNLGAQTMEIAARMKEYNPGPGWKAVQEEGIYSALSAK